MSTSPATDHAESINKLRLLQARRVIAMRQKHRVRNSALASIRVCAGFQWDADEKQRKAICDQAERILNHVWHSKPCKPEDQPIIKDMAGELVVMQNSYEPWTEVLRTYEKRARKIAKTLPIKPWVEQESGVSFDTIAVVLGETGNPSDFPWWKYMAKRLGLAPYQGRMGSTWKMSKPTLKAEEWEDYGYCGRRRSIMHTWAEAQVRNRTGYRELYEQHKKREHERTDENAPKNDGHAHKRAMLWMSRQFIRRLWWAWRKAEQGDLKELLQEQAA